MARLPGDGLAGLSPLHNALNWSVTAYSSVFVHSTGRSDLAIALKSKLRFCQAHGFGRLVQKSGRSSVPAHPGPQRGLKDKNVIFSGLEFRLSLH